MFKLTALLCATMFVVLLIGGEDRGQLRPGLAMAALQADQAPVTAEPAAPEIVRVAAPVAQPAEIAPVATPVVVEQAAPPVENATDPVFSLATFGDDAAATETPQSPAADGALAYVAGRSVNVREGPGKENAVVAKLSRGEAVTVVWQDDTGWSRVLIEGDGLEGYVSSDLLTPNAP